MPQLQNGHANGNMYLASEVNAVEIANVVSDYLTSGCVNDNEKEVQCDLITEDEFARYDPNRMTYKERIRFHLKEFCDKTSSHGIPMLEEVENTYYRIVWIVLLITCAAMFIFQAINVIEKYQRMGKITDIQLKFDTAPFPAITLCNLNPYKDSLLRDVEAVEKILNVFDNVMARAGKHNSEEDALRRQATIEERKSLSSMTSRVKRQSEGKASFEPAYSECNCDGLTGSMECTTDVTKKPDDEEKACLCAFDRESGDAWPCYPKADWKEETCGFCDEHSYCTLQPKEGLANMAISCLCQAINPFCVVYIKANDILKLWEYYGSAIFDDEAVTEALGFANMSDEVAIVTKAKENIIFAMSELSERQRMALSIQKKQLILKCSFNGGACDIDKDFKSVSDPTFGNCFTFNHNRSTILSSIRAGPMYGLRMLVYVNVTEYLPTTEAVGVRITIHDKDDYPFPDTFGYSAPTGYISSFGMRMSRMSRLPAPYGDCVQDGLTDNYIYDGYRYSTEGCYRSCFQNLVVKECGCGDPRFPVGNATHCQVFNPEARKCLEERTNSLGSGHGSFRCRCQQPCDQSVYTVSYSAAIWPSQSLNISIGNCDRGPDICNEHYMENGAMIEVFYEALNFEMFKESEAYGVVKMLADFGGQLGLWSGISVITICEFICLFCEIVYMIFNHHYMLYERKKYEEEQAQ